MERGEVRRLLILGLASLLVLPIGWQVSGITFLFIPLRVAAIILLFGFFAAWMAMVPPANGRRGTVLASVIVAIGPAINIGHRQGWNSPACFDCDGPFLAWMVAIAFGALVMATAVAIGLLAVRYGLTKQAEGKDLGRWLQPRDEPPAALGGRRSRSLAGWSAIGFVFAIPAAALGVWAAEFVLVPPSVGMFLSTVFFAFLWAQLVYAFHRRNLVPDWGFGLLVVPIAWALLITGVLEFFRIFCIFCYVPPVDPVRVVLYGVLAWGIGIMALWGARRRPASVADA